MTVLDDLIRTLSRLPGLGRKSAARIAYALLTGDDRLAATLANQISELKEKIVPCRICGGYTESDPCPICSDVQRNRALICVVEQPQDILTIESTREYKGLFHVLMGVIAPLEGIGPDNLRISQLLSRIEAGPIEEVILATNPTVEGDTTALYLQRILKERGVKVSRLASGLPVGGDLEYADRLTLTRSLQGRIEM